MLHLLFYSTARRWKNLVVSTEYPVIHPLLLLLDSILCMQWDAGKRILSLFICLLSSFATFWPFRTDTPHATPDRIEISPPAQNIQPCQLTVHRCTPSCPDHPPPINIYQVRRWQPLLLRKRREKGKKGPMREPSRSARTEQNENGDKETSQTSLNETRNRENKESAENSC